MGEHKALLLENLIQKKKTPPRLPNNRKYTISLKYPSQSIIASYLAGGDIKSGKN